ncbi:MAG TPA: hypothetical protein PKA63_11670 [Oligoflexia bacterium]|nr:hypothetical protein [Oligoflexia bacterium]HMP49312.1 hypothetical protein [Oligoflexia bacterium]
MNPLNKNLQETFLFSAKDLLANRLGNFSERQLARQRALVSNLLLGIGVFIFIMLGSLVVFGYGSFVSGTFVEAASSDNFITGIILGVIFLVIIVVCAIGGLIQVKKSRTKEISKAEGILEIGKTRPDAGCFEIKVGDTRIRLLTEWQREAFKVGTSYRVYYLQASVPIILSAEVIGTEKEAEEAVIDEKPVHQDEILKSQRKAKVVVLVLAVLTIVVPVTMFATADFSPLVRLVIFLGLFVLSAGFVWWGMRSTGN